MNGDRTYELRLGSRAANAVQAARRQGGGAKRRGRRAVDHQLQVDAAFGQADQVRDERRLELLGQQANAGRS